MPNKSTGKEFVDDLWNGPVKQTSCSKCSLPIQALQKHAEVTKFQTIRSHEVMFTSSLQYCIRVIGLTSRNIFSDFLGSQFRAKIHDKNVSESTLYDEEYGTRNSTTAWTDCWSPTCQPSRTETSLPDPTHSRATDSERELQSI